MRRCLLLAALLGALMLGAQAAELAREVEEQKSALDGRKLMSSHMDTSDTSSSDSSYCPDDSCWYWWYKTKCMKKCYWSHGKRYCKKVCKKYKYKYWCHKKYNSKYCGDHCYFCTCGDHCDSSPTHDTSPSN